MSVRFSPARLGNEQRQRINALLRRRYNGVTAIGLAQGVAACYGIDLTRDQASYALWNFTGYPGFFMSNPTQECRHQLANFGVARDGVEVPVATVGALGFGKGRVAP